MSRASVAQLLVLGAVTSCATITGLADKEAVDCPGDCEASAPPPRSDLDGSSGATDANLVVDTGPPKCNPSTDAACMPLPAGWTLSARAPLVAGQAPACPSGMTNMGTAQEAPSVQPSTCTCDSCSVTAAATCSGQLAYWWAPASACNNTGDPTHYKNPVAGTCYQDLFTSLWSSEANRFILPNPSGGTCAANPTKHTDRVSFGERSALCEDASRCSGGFCDARIDAPFAVCVGRPGDEECPEGFPVKHLAGTQGADVDCGTCSCTVSRQPCQGVVQHFSDTACTTGQVDIPANGVCGGPNTDGADFDSYKVVATSATTCIVGGATTPATNPRMKNPRTICCR
jgi:hypothetical protein